MNIHDKNHLWVITIILKSPLPSTLFVRFKESNQNQCKLFINCSLYVFKKTQPATHSEIWHTKRACEETQRLDKVIMKKDFTFAVLLQWSIRTILGGQWFGALSFHDALKTDIDKFCFVVFVTMIKLFQNQWHISICRLYSIHMQHMKSSLNSYFSVSHRFWIYLWW